MNRVVRGLQDRDAAVVSVLPMGPPCTASDSGLRRGHVDDASHTRDVADDLFEEADYG